MRALAFWVVRCGVLRQPGYDPVAPGWPGEPDTVAEARQHPELVANASIDDIAAHYTKAIDALEASPIIIGHSLTIDSGWKEVADSILSWLTEHGL